MHPFARITIQFSTAYVHSAENRRLAIVVSEDRTVDIIPLLRPQIRREQVDIEIALLESATLENYHSPRNWLDDHRFYLNSEQCERANRALDRLESLPKEMGDLVIITRRFALNPQFNDSYFFAQDPNPNSAREIQTGGNNGRQSN